MPTTAPQEITKLLRAWSEGDAAALDRLMPLVYAELHRMADRYMVREGRECTIQRDWTLAKAWLRREIDGSGQQ